MRIARVSLFCTLGLSACAAAPAAPAPEYPKLEAKTAPKLELSIAGTATKLTLPCAPSEAELDNGLDDDCNGQVDRDDPSKLTQALRVTLAHPNDVDLKLVLSAAPPAKEPATHSSTERVCDGSAAFATQRMEVSELEPGSYGVMLVRAAGCGADKPAQVDASLWLEGKAQGVYGVSVKPGESVQLATLDVK